MARLAYALSDWPLAYCMIDAALRITEKSTAYLTEEGSWDYSPYDIGAIACYRIGLYERSRQLAQQACALRPDDQRLENNLKLIEEKCGAMGQ